MGHRHRRNMEGVMCEVVKFTTACSGCFEAGEYGGNSSNYRWDSKAQCHIGNGCHECGFTGKRRGILYIPLAEMGVTTQGAGHRAAAGKAVVSDLRKGQE